MAAHHTSIPVRYCSERIDDDESGDLRVADLPKSAAFPRVSECRQERGGPPADLQLGVPHKTVRALMMKLRKTIVAECPLFAHKGTVEIDGAYIGG
jgi:hypothetical protein